MTLGNFFNILIELVIRTLQPLEYYKTFLDRKTRPDGRSLLEFRETTLNVNSIGTADGSAIVKCGNTTIICGIKAVYPPYILSANFYEQLFNCLSVNRKLVLQDEKSLPRVTSFPM